MKELAVLEGNKGIVSALAFSPDDSLLAAGDVSRIHIGSEAVLIFSVQSSGRIVLFDVKEKKVRERHFDQGFFCLYSSGVALSSSPRVGRSTLHV